MFRFVFTAPEVLKEKVPEPKPTSVKKGMNQQYVLSVV